MTYRLVLTFLTVFSINFPIFSQTLHVLIMADTFDETIGKSVKKDLNNFKDFAQKVATSTGMTLKMTTYQGDDYSSTNANNAIKSISPDANDTVLVYFSAHGSRTQSTPTKWPTIYFPDEVSIDQNEIYKKLTKKKPRLLLVIADVCNVFADEDESVPNVIPRSMNSNEALNYSTLFLNSKGSILASSSKPGQASIAYEKGGAYTINLLSAIKNAVKSSTPPRWADIMKISAKPIDPNSDSRQDPQFELFSFTEGGGKEAVAIVNPPSSKRIKYTFSNGKLEEKASKVWALALDGEDYELKEYDRNKTFVYLSDEQNGGSYALDIENKIFYEYDWDTEDWDTISENLK
ncbi:caspase family protein [Leptospira sp. 'Mane']|uniref:caspase family protein n=1 Tax=Leptospira sp. 'Mane' TaxID=3387407 RepID=UPI00398B7080